MAMKKLTQEGTILFSQKMLSKLSRDAVIKTPGIIGLTTKNAHKRATPQILTKVSEAHEGIEIIPETNNINLYVVCLNGMNIRQVCYDAQANVSYKIRSNLGIDVKVNVIVQNIG